jgi:uncharacterized metal-binding protein YceD (DUF177 family)
MIFEMARKCLVDWSSDAYTGAAAPLIESTSTDTESGEAAITLVEPRRKRAKVLPRWHPHSGISDINPNFRTEPPVMNNKGFAKSMWRNVRKPNKPSLWRHTLRIYDRMAELEVDSTLANTALKIQRSNIHHEGAMLACAKLGLWQRALEIYYHVLEVQQQQEENDQRRQLQQSSPQPTNQQQGLPQKVATAIAVAPRSSVAATAAVRAAGRLNRRVYVTDNMILSLIRACVRSSRQKTSSLTIPVRLTSVFIDEKSDSQQQQKQLALEEQEHDDVMLRRRIPLDTAMEILSTMEETHSIPVVSRHVNALAGAYQSLGFLLEARKVLETHLTNRTSGEEPEDGKDVLNVFDFCAKDKGSYSLLVQSSVASGDWASAVAALQDMTEAGLYPTSRHCNAWREISERQSQRRMVGSWKKKRDDYWLESVR